MTDPLLPIRDGHTQLTDEDRDGLIPTYISTRGELDEAEQKSIAEALLRKAPTAKQVLDDKYLRGLHKSMFGQVWKWAGKYRPRETNIGIEPNAIASEVRKLTQDTAAWIEYETYEQLEIVVRFHHRLVAIHPFPNGNGRFGRIAANMLSFALGGENLSWGSHLDVDTPELRNRYLQALHASDEGDMSQLMDFASS
jgi:Fic-DOC domain mobile mystery protein B